MSLEISFIYWYSTTAKDQNFKSQVKLTSTEYWLFRRLVVTVGFVVMSLGRFGESQSKGKLCRVNVTDHRGSDSLLNLHDIHWRFHVSLTAMKNCVQLKTVSLSVTQVEADNQTKQHAALNKIANFNFFQVHSYRRLSRRSSATLRQSLAIVWGCKQPACSTVWSKQWMRNATTWWVSDPLMKGW